MKEPKQATVTAWTSLVRAHNCALQGIESALKSANMPPLAWYDVLLELERAPNKKIRPLELENKLLLPQYGLSRLLTRIEKSGLLIREICEIDRRGQWLIITEQGIKTRKKMWRVYGPAIYQMVGDKLTDAETLALSRLLKKLAIKQ